MVKMMMTEKPLTPAQQNARALANIVNALGFAFQLDDAELARIIGISQGELASRRLALLPPSKGDIIVGKHLYSLLKMIKDAEVIIPKQMVFKHGEESLASYISDSGSKQARRKAKQLLAKIIKTVKLQSLKETK